LKNEKDADGKGKPLSKANAKAKRSAISSLYKDYEQSATYEERINQILGKAGQGGFQGLTRVVTEAVRDGNAEVREGKAPLPFNGYRDLAAGPWVHDFSAAVQLLMYLGSRLPPVAKFCIYLKIFNSQAIPELSCSYIASMLLSRARRHTIEPIQ